MDDVFRKYFEDLPSYVTVQDLNHHLIAVNRRFADDFGGQIGDLCYAAYKHRDTPCPVCPVSRTVDSDAVETSEEIVVRRDGKEAVFLINTSPIHNADHEVVAIIKTSTDITEVKKLQQKFRSLFEEVPSYISIQDRELRILEANRRFRADFGDPTHGRCYQLYKRRLEPCLVCPVASTFKDGESHSAEKVFTSTDGQQVNVMVYTAPIRNPAGEITSVMEMSANITEIRRLESQLTSLGLLVGSISHGIKGLLSGLDGGVYLVDTGFKNQDLARVQKGWEMVQRNVDRIRSMVLNVLYYAKDREVNWETVNVRTLVSDVCGVLSTRAQQLGVDLAWDVSESTGPLQADGRAMHALLVNLVENSLHACHVDKKKEQHRVQVTAAPVGDVVLFEVLDNGIGMDQETQQQAFSLFFSSKGNEGTGLGLFIANRIVTSHGGRISVESTPQLGTKISVEIPAKKKVQEA
jgi:signal transduction histidine kinase